MTGLQPILSLVRGDITEKLKIFGSIFGEKFIFTELSSNQLSLLKTSF